MQTQQIEFLTDELEASKIREETAKHMYDSLLKSMSEKSTDSILVTSIQALSVKELKNFQLEHYDSLKLSHSHKMTQLMDALKSSNDIIKEKEYQLKSLKLDYEETILALKQQIYAAQHSSSLNESYKSISEELL